MVSSKYLIFIIVIFICSTLYFAFNKNSEIVYVPINKTQKEDSLKAIIQVNRVKLIHDSLMYIKEVNKNKILSDYIKSSLKNNPLNEREIDSIIVIAKQNQVL